MDDIKRLVRILTDKRTHFIPQLDFTNQASLENRLFEILQREDINNDAAIINVLYNNKDSQAGGYRMLKARFRKKLLNQITLIDLAEADISSFQKVEAECNALLFKVNKLIYLQEYKIAWKLLEQVRTMAHEATLTPIVVETISEQKKLALTLNNITDYKLLLEEETLQKIILDTEESANDIYSLCRLQLHGSTSNRNSFLPQVPGVVERLKELWLVNNSPRIFNFYHKTRCYYYELIGDFANVAKAVDEAEDLFSKGKISPLWYNQRFNRFLYIYSLLRTKQYVNGLKLAEEYLVSFPEQNLNWFTFLENYFLLAMHQNEYTVASKILHKVYGSILFPDLHKVARSRWKMYKLYFDVLSDTECAIPEDDLTDYSDIIKDKLGFNYSLLVINFIKDLKTGDLELLEFHNDRFRKYTDKHFKSPQNKREKIFSKLVVLICKEANSPKICAEKGRILVDKLAVTPSPGDAFSEVEIVPYEQLWEICLEMLRKNNLGQPQKLKRRLR